MAKIRAKFEVPDGKYCESKDSACPMCSDDAWYCCLFRVDLKADSNNGYYCIRCEQCKQAEVEE